MKLLTTILLIIGITFSTTSSARGRYYFGDRDTIHFIQDIELMGAKGEALSLSYRTSINFFIAGFYLTDHGYVLSIKNSVSGSYYNLSDENISLYQSKGWLPNPLPVYQVELSEYLIGYSLWLILILFCLYYAAKSLFIKKVLKKQSNETLWVD